jgi:DNA invertase Pin-like site-specific DNA recombinase
MLIGYARTSTLEQKAGLQAQIRDLKDAGCDDKIFKEQVSSVDHREQLEQALDYIRDNDTLVVTRLDRLARSVRDLCSITDTLKNKNAHLKILNMNLDTSTATGELMLNLLASIAQFERELMLERQREGIAKAKADGKYKGRAPTARNKSDDVMKLLEDGIGASEIARQLEISRSSVYRIVKDCAN